MTWLTCNYPQIQMKPNSCDPQVSNLYAAHHHCILTDWQQWPGETKRHQLWIKWLNTSKNMKTKKTGLAPPYIYMDQYLNLLTVSLDPLDQEEGCRKYTQQATLQFYLWDHWHEEVGLKWVTSISSLLEDSQYERFRCNQVKLEEQNNINQLSCSSYQCSVVSKCKITLLSTFL